MTSSRLTKIIRDLEVRTFGKVYLLFFELTR